PMGSDRNLLFGILALQMDFIRRDSLIAAMHAWVLDKAKPLGQILLDQGALAPADRELLDAMVRRHLEKHGQDAERSLAAVEAPGTAPDRGRRAARQPGPAADLAVVAPRPGWHRRPGPRRRDAVPDPAAARQRRAG